MSATKAPTPLDITFCVPGMPYDGNTIRTKSLGGSESAGYYMGRALAKRGHRVIAFTNIEQPMEAEGVNYMPLSKWQHHATAAACDVHIIQRQPLLMTSRIEAKLSVLWCHDMAMGRVAHQFRGSKWNTDLTMVLSQYHAQQYKDVVGYEDRELYVTRNGFDFGAQPPVKGLAQRDPNLFVYCARPERGLDKLLKVVWPKLKELRPEARLIVCTYDNQAPEMAGFYAEMDALKKLHGVQDMGALTKNQLYSMLSSAAAYLYPTPGDLIPEFREISCIAAIEAQACGLPFIHTGAGALRETVAPLYTDCPVEEMANIADHLLKTDGHWDQIQARQLDHVRRYDWDVIAAEWEQEFTDRIEALNDNPERLARWFYKRSEIEGARAALQMADGGAPEVAKLLGEIEEKYAFTRSDEAFAAHYAEMGKVTLADLESRKDAFTRSSVVDNPEPRFGAIRAELKQLQPKRLLDYGCGHGWSSLHFAAHLPGAQVDGIDVDPGAIGWTTFLMDGAFAGELNGRCRFTTDHNTLRRWAEAEPYDAVLVSEVLEHVLDPVETLQEAESYVRPGGRVIVTVPYGPWEYNGPSWHGHRNHIRELDCADLHEMLGHKPKFAMAAALVTFHPDLNDPCGFFYVAYEADHSPVRERDLTRKLRIARPRETLSANIIAGAGADQTLRWCLDSLKHVADEIIVGNTGGLSNAGIQACLDYGARIIDAPSPMKEGFSAARNAVLDASRSDWILAIDTDERLIEPKELTKFLRKSAMAGYSIRQVHMSADQPIQPDIPVRIFRRDGGNRYVGLIHEHPELGVNKGPGPITVLTGMPVLWHVGYSNNQVRAQRFFRNRPLLERDLIENPDRVLGFFLEARDQMLMAQEYITRAGGKFIPEQARGHAERCLEYCRKFRKANVPLAGIAIEGFKTDALRILGRGFDATVILQVQREGVGDQGQMTMRFEDKADLEDFIRRQIADKVDPITAPLF